MKKILGALTVSGLALALLVGPSGSQDAESAAVPTVSLQGSGALGSDLTVVPATWSSTPRATSFEWLRDGEGDVLSTGRTYRVAAEDVGHTMVVVERVTLASGRDETSSTPLRMGQGAPVVAPKPAPAAKVPAVNRSRPTFKGTTKVGKKLRVRSKGRWTAPGHTYSYQWLRNGKAIKKATKTSYRLTKKDRRKKISLRVTAKRPGYPSVSATSSRKRVR